MLMENSALLGDEGPAGGLLLRSRELYWHLSFQAKEYRDALSQKTPQNHGLDNILQRYTWPWWQSVALRLPLLVVKMK